MNFDYLAIETIISYKFENKSLLLQAFTHKSFSNQHRDYVSYERLEFLGDSLIGFIVADYLYKSDDEKEGVLTVKKSEMVSSVPLATVASEHIPKPTSTSPPVSLRNTATPTKGAVCAVG